MGALYSSTQNSEQPPEESSSEDDDYIPYRGGNIEEDSMDPSNFETDAVETTHLIHPGSSRCEPFDDHAITLDKVAKFDKELDFFEKVSLVYLLFETAEIALQHLIQLEQGAHINVLDEWAQAAKKSDNWQGKLLEALCIIQNYQIISELGYPKNIVNDRFLPLNMNTSVFIDLKKKQLYRTFEDFTTEEITSFLAIVKRDCEQKQFDFQNFELPHLEMYVLHWITIKYISSTDFSNLCQVFKIMEKYEISDCFKSAAHSSPQKASERAIVCNTSEVKKDLTQQPMQPVNSPTLSACSSMEVASFPEMSMSSMSSGSTIQQDRIRKNSYRDRSYVIDPDNPGLCLIINQKHFYREFDKEYVHLLPETDKPLEPRKGTDVDRNSLKDTFKKFGFETIVENDLTHLDLINTVKETVNKVTTHSSLIICILSHGVQGMVYGVNSIPVKVQQIQNIICKTNFKNLKRKPKVLILQSCQGTQCQQVIEDDEGEDDEEDAESETMTMDGPVAAVPRTADMLIFWATVPGYSAVRDKEKGTWFIQALCKTINERAADMHFEEICTLVNQEVINKRWDTKAMVPFKECTLSRFFFLPRLQRPN